MELQWSSLAARPAAAGLARIFFVNFCGNWSVGSVACEQRLPVAMAVFSQRTRFCLMTYRQRLSPDCTIGDIFSPRHGL